MYERIEIKGYRRFEHLVVDGLTRVNLIVGKNNAGKTSLLEAIQLLVGPLSPEVVFASCQRRNELSRRLIDVGPREGRVLFDPTHLFHGHVLDPGQSLALTASTDDASSASTTLTFGTTEANSDLLPEGLQGTSDFQRYKEFFLVEGDQTPARFWPAVQALSLDPSWHRASLPPTPFIATSGDDVTLPQLWSEVALTEEEDHVLDALRLLDDRVERLAFTSEDLVQHGWIRLRGIDKRLPLNSLGDGMSRVLRLALHLAKAAGRVLLVDEIYTGLHHTVMRDVWRMIIEGARRLDVQVFATTHSHDCLMSLAELSLQEPDLAEDISVHRIEAGARETVQFASDRLASIARHDIEIR